MTSKLTSLLQLSAALGSGLIAGVFFAFSSFVLPALARLPAPLGIAAMQSINLVVLNRSFLGVFLGTAGCCVLLVPGALSSAAPPGSRLAAAGALLYLLGCVLVTCAGNVPENEALAPLAADTEQAAAFWGGYVARWAAWNHVRTAFAFAASLLFILSLCGCSRFGACAAPEARRAGALPTRLSETGRDDANVREFRPRFELWSDGAVKRRFIALPRDAQIDTGDLDDWSFPVGTRLWKEFTVGGVRVETRFLEKTGPGSQDWAAQAYLWLPDGTDALAAPSGADDVLGTAHDVPSSGQCWGCHGGRKSFVLGFSALQLSAPAEPGHLGLSELVAEQRLSRSPPTPWVVPGDETARAALGYLHANCAHCHNQRRPESAAGRCYDPSNELDFALLGAELGSVTQTAAYRSARGAAMQPGAPDESRLLELMSTRGFLQQMPPLGTERVDAAGVSAVRGWIAGLR